MIKKLRLSQIVTDAGTQVRASLNEATVADYAEALGRGAKFPPVIVFYDGIRHIAADGFHRIHAARSTGATEIECDIRQGSKTDALKFALGCNAHHGLRRTNADKRQAVAMALKEFPKASNVAIAAMCLVSDDLVAEIRKSQNVENQRNEVTQPSEIGGLTRIGLDGRERKLPPPPMARRAGEREDETKATNGTDGSPGRMSAAIPPAPSQVLDGTGWPIPTQLIPLWQRADEVQEMLATLSRLKGALRAAQETKDKLFAEINFSSALSQLDQAWTDIKTAKPFAVCPICQGQLPDQCTLCRGRGFVSEHRWNTCVTREDKEFRFKARQRACGQS